MQHGYANTLFKTIGFGLWNRISSVVRQKEKKKGEFALFLLRSAHSLFSALLLRARERFPRKKRGRLWLCASLTQIIDIAVESTWIPGEKAEIPFKS
jgi:hypothetical protein